MPDILKGKMAVADVAQPRDICDSNVFRNLFENDVERGIAIGLVRDEGFAVDASLIKADVWTLAVSQAVS